MHRLAILMLFAIACWGQSIVDPKALGQVMSRFEPSWQDHPLACSVTPFGPLLNYSLRIQAGYVVRIPMNQYFGPRHGWFMLTRITPEGGDGKPVFLASRTRLPDVPRTKVEVEIGGGYLLGEGRYAVRWMMMDDQGRVCRKDWNIHAALKKGERQFKVALAPYTVAPFSLLASTRPGGTRDDRRTFSATILLHAAPLSPWRTNLRGSDRMLLIGSLAALLEHIPATSVRLVVFNLDQHKELYRNDHFAPAQIDQVQQSINDLQLNAVSIQTLENSRGHVDLLAELLNREIRAEKPSDAVVFLGPPGRFLDKVPRSAIQKLAALPRFFYLQYRPFFRRPGPSLPDSINLAVSELKGWTVSIHTPEEFAKAILELEKRATEERRQ
jgi:hypothetical protein